MNRCVHIIFLKYPAEGRVKTRLAATIGSEKALRIYKKLAEKIVSECRSESYDTVLFIDENIDGFQSWLGSDFTYAVQSGNGLGGKLDNAFKWAYAEGYEKCAVTGSDVAYLTSAELFDAFNLLEMSDSVIGKSPDGGYYLIAFNKNSYLPDVFFNIEWSTDTVLMKTVEKLEKNNNICMFIRDLPDIDTEEDLKLLSGDYIV